MIDKVIEEIEENVMDEIVLDNRSIYKLSLGIFFYAYTFNCAFVGVHFFLKKSVRLQNIK